MYFDSLPGAESWNGEAPKKTKKRKFPFRTEHVGSLWGMDLFRIADSRYFQNDSEKGIDLLQREIHKLNERNNVVGSKGSSGK